MYNGYAKEALEALSKGAFLSVADGKVDNIMTIAWGNIGIMWSKPVFTVMVRYSRHTYNLMEKADSFAINIPLKAQLKEALVFCGSKSGRDFDKWKETGLTKLKANKIDSPLVGECDLYYECKLIGKQPLAKGMLIPEVDSVNYGKGDYHVLYYGEIVGTYLK